MRFKWWSFLLLGIVFLASAIAAVLLPTASTTAAGLALGGGVEIVGGILVYLNPLKAAVAITLLIAIVFVVLDVSQIGCAFRIRRARGWIWPILSGLVALAMSLVLVFTFPRVRECEAGVVAGISLVVSGTAYVGIAFAVRKALAGDPAGS